MRNGKIIYSKEKKKRMYKLHPAALSALFHEGHRHNEVDRERKKKEAKLPMPSATNEYTAYPLIKIK